MPSPATPATTAARTAAPAAATTDDVIDLRDSSGPAAELRRLLDAALVVLERSGWQGLKVERVLHQAGLSTRCFYRHFAGKDELLAVLLADEVADVVALADERALRSSDPARQVLTWIESIVEVSRHPATAERARFFLTMGGLLERELPDEVAKVRMLMVSSLAEIIERGRAVGSFATDDPRRDASAIHCLMVGCMIASADTGVPPSPTEVAHFAARALLVPTAESW